MNKNAVKKFLKENNFFGFSQAEAQVAALRLGLDPKFECK